MKPTREPTTTEPSTATAGTTATVLRPVRRLVAWYLVLSLATLVAVVLLRHDSAVVDPAVWTRTVIVVASAVLTHLFAVRAAHGSRGAYRRLRVVTAVMTVAIAVIVALPGAFPLWLRIEQSVCGVLLLVAVVIANSRDVRAVFRSA
ncbi:hypothetical protein [Streptomyces beihaiensis]|uniref:Integral membrane protein n=1 Tax=Streptomyces beihaiensis TaxID=2984495 RepID=A0ABT3TWC4_9ACTN|nr:hypothetical protein [Streptomyces beihaiensis]MCX3060283.1 hypothetical protein [Streptomyces beihaiensis]